MTAPPYILEYAAEFLRIATELKAKPPQSPEGKKLKKIQKTLRLLEANPGHPGLASHKYHSVKGPNGEEVWESYVENHTPSAWRLFWTYGPGQDVITVLTVGPHP